MKPYEEIHKFIIQRIKNLLLEKRCNFIGNETTPFPILMINNKLSKGIIDGQCGCYLWINLHNFKCYVGRSINIKNRIRTEVYGFRQNKCCELRKLKNAVNKYSLNSFVVLQLSISDKENIIKDEVDLIQAFDSMFGGYNCNLGGDGNVGHQVTENQIKKQKSSLKSYWTDERRREHSERMKRFNKEHPEIVDRMRKTMKEKFNTEEMKNKIKNGMKNSKHTPEKRAKNHSKSMKEYFKNNEHWLSSTHSLISPEGKIYKNITNITRFCRDMGLASNGNMFAVIHGKQESYKGWRKY